LSRRTVLHAVGLQVADCPAPSASQQRTVTRTAVCAGVTRRHPHIVSEDWLLWFNKHLEDSCWCERSSVVRKGDCLGGSHTVRCELSCEVVQKDETEIRKTDGPRTLQPEMMQERGGTACLLTLPLRQVALKRNKLLYVRNYATLSMFAADIHTVFN